MRFYMSGALGVGQRESMIGGGVASAVGNSAYGGQEIAGGFTVGDVAGIAGGLLARPGQPVQTYAPAKPFPWMYVGLGVGGVIILAVAYKKLRRKNPRRRR